ncbi:manganese efflux pump MntP [Alicyclobacillus vulcanalis]|uniref:Putative Mn2+ efflux pump MntP n=1 Tax=Alicyclobacillus vulcanalis TaxID=252246 RepID=A0A1N7LFX7_9BACL|nr:manganese efflux pump [Alicyclobacillus vulcanalis]SIS72720.1 Putative Mn2+ efflux pump MntP [Alicyclobacillus vulcanalis]
MSNLQAAVEIAMMAVALGMDALSLSIGVGLGAITRRQGVELALTIGVWHVILTIAGLLAGDLVGHYLGHVARLFAAVVVMGLGLHMAYHTWKSSDGPPPRPLGNWMGRMTFAASVSIDALSVGFGLGLYSVAYGLVSAAAFGVASTLMCGFGLLIGKQFGRAIGRVGEMIGSAILILCGVMWLI